MIHECALLFDVRLGVTARIDLMRLLFTFSDFALKFKTIRNAAATATHIVPRHIEF